MPRNIKVPQETKSAIRLKHINNLNHGMLAGESQDLLAAEYGLSDRTIRDYVKGVYIAEHTAPKEIRPEPESVIINNIRPTLADVDDAHDGRLAEVIYAEREAKKHKQDSLNHAKRIRHLEHALDEAEKERDIALEISDSVKPVKIEVPASSTDSEAVAVVVASDWHMGAMVNPATVNYLNEVNPEITATRIEKFFQSVVKLVKKEQQDVTIKQMVLALIGDMIEGYLHPETIEDATLSPMQQMIMAEDCIAGGIEYILANTDLEKIIIPTCPGNHGRATEKMRAATNYKNSYEQLMYWNLAKHFKNESRVEFRVVDSYFNYITVYDHVLRFHHGDACKFGGGIGGLMIPLRKFIHRANQQIYADTSICGHFHSLIVDFDVLVNGSLVGPSAYSMKLGFPPERPQQIFRLLDSNRGWTMFAPILVVDRESKSGRIIG